MNVDVPFTVIRINKISHFIESDSDQYYALIVALQTVRDRCFNFQSKFGHLLENNLKSRQSLKIEVGIMKANNEKHIGAYENIDIPFDRVEESLWSKRSPFTRDKPSVQRNFAAPSEDSSVFRLSKQFSSALKHDDMNVKEDSLEEISLREDVYGRGNSSKDGDEENASEEENLESLGLALKDIVEKMKKDQEVLKQQQEGLKSALAIFRKFMKDGPVCKLCLSRELGHNERENKIVGTEELTLAKPESEGYRPRERIRVPIPTSEDTPPLPLEDKICPLCGKYFHCSTPFNTFHEHVVSHFVEEDAEDDTANNLEIVT